MNASPRKNARLPLILCLLVGGAAAAQAELVVLATGAVMKVDTYEVSGERIRLTLPSGGEVVIPLLHVDRIVDDEVVPLPPPPPVSAPLDFPLAWTSEAQAPPVKYGDLIATTAQRHGVNPELVAAVIRAESASNPRAVSRKGARGLMQLMPATAAQFGVATHELFEPERNLEAGVRYLAVLVGKLADLDLVLAAYNAGEGAVARHGGVPPYRETREYIARIRRFLGLEPPSAGLAAG